MFTDPEYNGHTAYSVELFKKLFNAIPERIPESVKKTYKAHVMRLLLQKLLMDFSLEEILANFERYASLFAEHPYRLYDTLIDERTDRRDEFVNKFNSILPIDRIVLINSAVDIYSFGILLLNVLTITSTKGLIRTEDDVNTWKKTFDVMVKCLDTDDIRTPDKPVRMYELFKSNFGYQAIPGPAGGGGGAAAAAAGTSAPGARYGRKKRKTRKGKGKGKGKRGRKRSLKRTKERQKRK